LYSVGEKCAGGTTRDTEAAGALYLRLVVILSTHLHPRLAGGQAKERTTRERLGEVARPWIVPSGGCSPSLHGVSGAFPSVKEAQLLQR